MRNSRHIQEQRVGMTNFLITVNSAIVGLVVAKGFDLTTLPLSITLSVLGFYGVLASMKFTQHYHHYYLQAKGVRQYLAEIVPDSKIEEIYENAREMNRQKYPRLEKYIKIYVLWSLLHVFFIVVGLLLIIYTITKW